VFKTLGYWINYILKTKDPLKELNVILIYYVMKILKIQKIVIILKALLSI
jgi:hypothetical protein